MESNMDLPSDTGSKNRFRDAPRKPDFTIDQNWASYSAAEHDRWDRLFRRSFAALQNRACDEFIAMMKALSLSDGGIPDMEELSDRLEGVTGWRVVPVDGLVPDDVFFNHLANRLFPAGAFIRSEQALDYLQEPDIFHDIFGHVPLLANPVFADFMSPTAKADSERCNLADWLIWRGSTGTRSSSV
jgi:phenylalanine-4-hydroxylase